MTRSERLKRTLMMCCALILFILGLWLLLEPVQARGEALHGSEQALSPMTRVVDNVVANSSGTVAAVTGMDCR